MWSMVLVGQVGQVTQPSASCPARSSLLWTEGARGGKTRCGHSHVAQRVLPAWSLYFPWHSRTFSLFLPQGRVSAPKFIFRHGQRYRLCRIVQHIGDTLQKGHYVVAVWKSGRWCRCSDADVASLSPRGLADMEPSVAMYEICSSTISGSHDDPGPSCPPGFTNLGGLLSPSPRPRHRPRPAQLALARRRSCSRDDPGPSRLCADS